MAWAQIIGAAVQMLGQYREGQAALRDSNSNAESVERITAFNAEFIRSEAAYDAAMIRFQGDYDSAVAFANAGLAMNNAARVRESAAYDASRARDKIRRIRGEQIAQFGKSGIQLEGSAEDVLYASALAGERDALALEYAGDVEAANLAFESSAQKFKGNTILTMTRKRAGATLWAGDMRSSLQIEEGISRANIIRSSGEAATQSSLFQMGSTGLNLYGSLKK